jgi:uncharacterized membrane protein (UPF0127 family)
VAGSFLAPLAADRARGWRLLNQRTARILAASLEPAFDSRTRRRGLLGRAALERDAALILAPCSSIHTFFMQFPIDVAFVARDGRVLHLRERMGPWRISGAVRAFAAVELEAGAIARTGTRCGDVLLIEPH